jgi:hypothetical protein
MTRTEKIRALRAKADSTTFPPEADALRAKANELETAEPETASDLYADQTLEEWMEEMLVQLRADAWGNIRTMSDGDPYVEFKTMSARR